MVIDFITLAQYEQLNRELRPELPSNEVCEYTRWAHDSVDKRLIKFQANRVDGKLRYRMLDRGVRILTSDVFAILPAPETEEQPVEST